MSTPASPPRRRGPLALWAAATLGAALTATLVDAALLQARKAFFTGGFLATAYTRSVGESALFLCTSLLADAAVAGLTAVAGLALLSPVALTRRARVTAVALAAFGPLLVADFVNYRLWTYLGDAFDFSLMFDLTGRSPREILAVAAGHLVGPGLLLAACMVVAIVLLGWLNRPRDARARVPLTRRPVLAALALAAGALAVTTGARAASDTFDDGLQRKPSGRAIGWVAEAVTDVDRDGFGIGAGLRDPDAFNAAVYPYAADVPGDGIDQDGVAGDLPAGLPPYTEGPASPAAWVQHPNVVLIVLESFRADAVGRTVGGRPVTPVIDALAARGVSASRAFSHNGYTAQSRFHIFSGSLADVRDHRTLIDDFKRQGYEVAYFSAQDDSFGGPALSVGMDRADVAYDARQDRKRRYSTYSTAGSLAVPSAVLLERIQAFLDARTSTRPLFLYVNFHDTHYPYYHPGIEPLVSDRVLPEADIVPANADALKAMYYNTAANVDRAIGVALAAVERRLGAPPAVIVTGDHGESLFDEGFLGHGYALNDVQTRIPLVVAGLPLVVRQPFGQADLRDAIGEAHTRPPGVPQLLDEPAREVFQYLGNIDRPRQVAFATGAERLIYDFRDGRARLPGSGAWQAWTALAGADRGRLDSHVQLWERMMLARGARARDAAE
jgi:arylsulfatase A-like enzyme